MIGQRQAIFANLIAAWATFILLMAPLAAWADSTQFRLLLGTRQIGQLSVAPGQLISETTRAPLGIGNGRFSATLKPAGAGQLAYASYSSSDDRHVEILFKGAQALKTGVMPARERTDLSDAGAVPGRAVDPVRAMAGLLHVGACPAGLRIYDGRRLAEVATQPAATEDGHLRCTGRYRVLGGARHLEPLGLASARLVLDYAPAGQAHALREIGLKAGPFAITIAR